MASPPNNASDLEKKLILAMGLKDATELDEMLAAPISDWAVKHSEAPDDEHEIYDRAIEYLDQLSNARERFNTLSEPAYVN